MNASTAKLSPSFCCRLYFYVLLLFLLVLSIGHASRFEVVDSERSIEILLHDLFASGLLESNDILYGGIKHFLDVLSTES